MRRLSATLLIGVGLTLLGPPGTALAQAASPASCIGHEASAISPPGSSEEIPAGMPGLKAFIEQTFPGLPPGAIFKFIGSLHEGSHEACDEALEG
jgi:hypothetical protein